MNKIGILLGQMITCSFVYLPNVIEIKCTQLSGRGFYLILYLPRERNNFDAQLPYGAIGNCCNNISVDFFTLYWFN